MKATYSAGFVGCGNMGGALARAALRAKEGGRIAVYDPAADKLAPLCERGAVAMPDAVSLATSAHLIFLGVKPAALTQVLATMARGLRDNTDAVIVSMAAAVSIATIQEALTALGLSCPVIRIMPNTPAAVGQGMTVYATSSTVTASDEADFLALMQPSGEVLRIEERHIDAAGCVSGCGPAFAYIFAEALADGGVACGLSRTDAARLAAQMLAGAAEMLKTYGHPADLKDAVCSPGGTTIEGVKALEDGGLRAAAMQAVKAAYERTLQLKSK